MPENELPELVRLDAMRFGRRLVRQFPAVRNNPKLAREIWKIISSQICTRKRAGRPPRPEITRAEELFKRHRTEFGGAEGKLWERICVEVVPGWAALRPQQRTAAKRKLRNQVTARRAARRTARRLRRQRKESPQRLFSKKKSEPLFLSPETGSC